MQVEANGINSITTSAIQVYPNPTNDVLHIDNLVETTSFQILNIVGQCVQQGIMQAGNNTIATQALPSGIYMLVMTDVQGRRSIIRLVKE
ncbi:MAG: T9SS type A sorting domain-containing protein [Bacteroidota bacterium]